MKSGDKFQSVPRMVPPQRGETIPLFDDFTLDLARGCLLRRGELVHLRPQSYEVLRVLVENKGRLISKNELIEEVWKGRAVTDDALVQCLKDVRSALGAEGKLYFRTVRGRGYIFDPQLDRNGASASNDSDSHQARTLPPLETNSFQYTRILLISIAALLCVGIAAFYIYRRSIRSTPEITSIAVLPFVNSSGNQDLEYLSDGVSERLIDRLSQQPGIKVIASSSSFRYKGKDVDPKEIGTTLGVQALVTGRVIQYGDVLQVRAEFVDARVGTQLWSELYNRKTTDFQQMTEEIARAISSKLGRQMTGAHGQLLASPLTQNSEAYQFYLRGLFYKRKGGFENIRKALDFYTQALTLDPNFATAWIGMADAYRYLVAKSLIDPKEALSKSRAAVMRALELDERLPSAHGALARIKHDEWDFAGAESEYKRAIELNPSLAEAHSRYSQYLSSIGKHTEALAECKLAQELDPLLVSLREPAVLYVARRYDEATEKLQQTLKLQPEFGEAHGMLGLIYDAKEMHSQAVEEYRKWIKIDGETTSILCYLGYALAKSGDRSEATTILAKLKTNKEYVSPGELTVLYIGLGDHERALETLERGYEAHDPQLGNLKVDPFYDSLRSNPRFQDILRRISFPS